MLSSAHATVPTHSIAGLLLYCALFAFIVEEGFRRTAFTALYAGAILHLAIDLTKDSVGRSGDALFFPFWNEVVELEWYWPEDGIWFLPVNLAIIVAIEALSRRKRSA